MDEIKQLKKENKKLKNLLKDAAEILTKYRHVVEMAHASTVSTKMPAKRRKKTATKKVVPARPK